MPQVPFQRVKEAAWKDRQSQIHTTKSVFICGRSAQSSMNEGWNSYVYQAHAYASVRGSAPALMTPVLGSITMAASDPSCQGPWTLSL